MSEQYKEVLLTQLVLLYEHFIDKASVLYIAVICSCTSQLSSAQQIPFFIIFTTHTVSSLNDSPCYKIIMSHQRIAHALLQRFYCLHIIVVLWVVYTTPKYLMLNGPISIEYCISGQIMLVRVCYMLTIDFTKCTNMEFDQSESQERFKRTARGLHVAFQIQVTSMFILSSTSALMSTFYQLTSMRSYV